MKGATGKRKFLIRKLNLKNENCLISNESINKEIEQDHKINKRGAYET